MMKHVILVIIVSLFSSSINTQNVKEVSRDWTSFSQFLDVKSDTKKKFKVIASVKVETDDDSAWAWFHVMEHQANHMGQLALITKRIN